MGPPFAVPAGAGPGRGPREVPLLADTGTERTDDNLQELRPPGLTMSAPRWAGLACLRLDPWSERREREKGSRGGGR